MKEKSQFETGHPGVARRASRRSVLVGFALCCSVLMGGADLWPSGAVEVFIDATRGDIKKIPIAIFTFKEDLPWDGQNLTDVLKADLRRSLLFEVGDWKGLGIKPEINSRPAEDTIRRAGTAGWWGQGGGGFPRKGREPWR